MDSKWYCECGQCEDCSNEPIELRSLDGSVIYVEKETREQWKARILATEN